MSCKPPAGGFIVLYFVDMASVIIQGDDEFRLASRIKEEEKCIRTVGRFNLDNVRRRVLSWKNIFWHNFCRENVTLISKIKIMS